jgi:hypothetical protein
VHPLLGIGGVLRRADPYNQARSALGPLSGSASVVAAPALFAVISPFCWIAGLIVTYRRNRYGARVRFAGWAFVVASGIAMVSKLIILEHFNRR